MIGCLCASLVHAQSERKVVLDQLGYAPSEEKNVFLVSDERTVQSAQAVVIDAASGKEVARLRLPPANQDRQTGDWIVRIDLSYLRRPGRYTIRIPSVQPASFAIGDDARLNGMRTLLRSFFLQRCGRKLDDPQTALRHAACHTSDGAIAHDDEVNAKGKPLPVAGGWHDAGDYGKYVATTAVAIGRILNAWERAPAALSFDDLGIPESGNGMPDVLDEMKIGLDWMLAMQRADGAVYRKVGGTKWPQNLRPEEDRERRLVYGVSSPETAKAAAAWAQAARMYAQHSPQDADRYLRAARRAWTWLTQTRGQRFDFREGDDNGSGPYRRNQTDTEASLEHDNDDRLWAAVELFLTTREPAWMDEVRHLLPALPVNLYEWKDASALGMSYFLWHPALTSDPLARHVRERFLQRAKEALSRVESSGYRIANHRFIWGSNKMTVEEGMFLCHAYTISGKRRYLDAARDQLHYIFGRNHFGKSFVSGVGSDPVRHVSHLFARAADVTIPGLLVGGPNELEQSKIAPQGKGPLSWADDARSYATNEYAIDYNASLIGLIVYATSDCFSK